MAAPNLGERTGLNYPVSSPMKTAQFQGVRRHVGETIMDAALPFVLSVNDAQAARLQGPNGFRTNTGNQLNPRGAHRVSEMLPPGFTTGAANDIRRAYGNDPLNARIQQVNSTQGWDADSLRSGVRFYRGPDGGVPDPHLQYHEPSLPANPMEKDVGTGVAVSKMLEYYGTRMR